MATTMLPSAESTSGQGYMLDLIWKDKAEKLKRHNNEVTISFDIVTVLGSKVVEEFKSRLSTILGTPTVAIEDENNKIYRICAMPTIEDRNDHSPLKSEKIGNRGSISSTSSKSDKAVHIKRQKIPRPPNAFILYRQRYHPVVKAEHPEFHNNQISILLGKQWKAESMETKAEFKAMAEDIKRKHAEEYPNYQYAPRKPSERKRRSTARRNAFERRTSSVVTSPPDLPFKDMACGSTFETFGDCSYRVAIHNDPNFAGESLPFTQGSQTIVAPCLQETFYGYHINDADINHNMPFIPDTLTVPPYAFDNNTGVTEWTQCYADPGCDFML
ncbi:mating type transcriptional activator [Ascosphaera apis ARSEF 7405]|uniref:Mating type transcriptional activator n=2 Tax=Ascosphaera apis TaxID=5105 RepID=A0A167VL34_9EURO|nr:mating type transcriptional activator [Ascosphaera apis]KZZ87685.1 mating type transcriptional activator [Ascosphaera apis ARSEF 7405]